MIRRLRSEDIPVVTAMIRESFSPSLWPYMTATQHGIGAFLEVAIRYPRSVEPRHLVVAVGEGTDVPAGFADFKAGPDGSAVLSYICVAPSARGQGLATAMFQDFLGAYPNLRTIALDTFRENERARSLYEHWGFSAVTTASWVTRPLPPAAEPPRVSGLPVSLAAHNSYGFCELQLDPPGIAPKLGVLGETVLRCFSRDTFEDAALLGSARGLLGSLTTAFAVVPESVEEKLDVPHDVLLLSDRMSLNVGRAEPIREERSNDRAENRA